MPSCQVCGPRLRGCHRCGATFGHLHITVTGRDGKSETVAVCGAHTPPSIASHPGTPERPARLISDGPTVKDEAKRARDRERRRAQRVVLDRHAAELAEVLAEIRGGS